MSIDVVHTSFDDPETKRTWNALYQSDQLVTNTPFQCFEWNSEWWRCYGNPMPHAELLMLRVDIDGTPVAIAPFVMYSRTLGAAILWRTITFIGAPLSPYTDILVHPDHIDVVWTSVLSYVNTHYSHTWFEFGSVISGQSLHQVAAMPDTIIKTPAEEYLANIIPHHASEYFINNRGLAKSLKSWQSNQLYKWYFIRGYDEQLTDTLMKYNIASFGDSSYFRDSVNADFFRNACRAMSNDVWYAVISYGTPVSILVGFADNETLYHFQSGTTRNHDDPNMRLGLMNMYRLLHYSWKHGYSKLDMLRGTERHKYHFEPHSLDSEDWTYIPAGAAPRYQLCRLLRSVAHLKRTQ